MRSVVTPPLLDIMYDFCTSLLPFRPIVHLREWVLDMKEENTLIERDEDDVVRRSDSS